ncbi:Holliday junction branch migration protein RuvA [Bacteroidaceae bacterium HV4-6-C5C]|jgi:Holliday junction DNA helicase RuvA|nr:Holliday junction branch migration protein RuvA [Bacteroidaceae bacterium HV4-6-C5C]
MIEYIRGGLAELSPATAIIDCNGLGYAVNISLNTYAAIQGKKECKLYIYEAIREDAYTLYGFVDKQERELFLMLLSVSGIGGNTARMILSALSPAELINIISTENATLLKTVKGIGLKTAQRVIVDLKDKIKTNAFATGSSENVSQIFSTISNQIQEEAVAALTMLGFAPAPSQKVVFAIIQELPDAPVEQVIKLALKRL